MPFKSKKQETFLKINYPKIARKWAKKSKKFNLSALGLEKYDKSRKVKGDKLVEGESFSHEGIEGGPRRPPYTYKEGPKTYRMPKEMWGMKRTLTMLPKKAVYKNLIEKKKELLK